MVRRIVLLIFALALIVLAGSLTFIQSPRFAGFVKGVIANRLPSNLGIDGDFSDLTIHLFPPKISINHPRVTLRKRNVLNLPQGSEVSAERIDLSFQLLQIFTGNLRVDEFLVMKGDIQLSLDPALFATDDKKKAQMEFHWDELLQIRAEAIALEETRVRIKWLKPAFTVGFTARYFRLGQWSGRGGLGYDLETDIREIRTDYPDVPQALDRLHVRGRINASGLQLDDLSLQQKGLSAQLSGSVKGNVIHPKGLNTQADLKFTGSVEQLLEAFGIKQPAKGNLVFAGKLTGDLEHPWEKLKFDGQVTGDSVRFREWEADRMVAEASWQSSKTGGEVSVTKALVESNERPKAPGIPGKGGKITASPFKFAVGGDVPIQIPLHLERAQFQWFAAPQIEKAFPFNFYASGPVKLEVTPGPNWLIRAEPKVTVEDLLLDNLSLKERQPLFKIIEVPKLEVDAAVTIDKNALKIDSANLALAKSHFQGSGKFDFETGLDIRASGPIHLSEIGRLAQNEIRGEGMLSAHVHGPLSRIITDFDLDIKDGYYVQLYLGDVRGRITLDEKPGELYLDKLQARRGPTHYNGNGAIHLKEQTIELELDAPRGNLRDILPIFNDLTKELWWYPTTASGDIDLQVKIGGKLDPLKLVVDARATGKNWEYLGEKFKDVRLTGGYNHGRFHAENIHAVKNAGTFLGRISFDMVPKVFNWNFHTSELAVTDFDHLAKLDIPIRGKVAIRSLGYGREGEIEATSEISATDVMVRGIPMPPSELKIRSTKGLMTMKGLALGGQASLDMQYDFKPGANSFLQAAARNLDFSPILLLLNPKLIVDTELAGEISGDLNLNFRSGQVELANGSFGISQYLLAKKGVRFQLVEPVSVEVKKGTFDLKELSIEGNGRRASLLLRSEEGDLDGKILGELDLSVIEFFNQVLAQGVGAAKLDFGISGFLKEPTIFGRASFEGALIKLTSLESPFENITGSMVLRQNVVTLQGMECDLANGRVIGEGSLRVFANKVPELAINAKLLGNKLKVYPFQYAKMSGKLHVHGADLPYAVEGAINLESALSRESLSNPNQARGLKAAKFTPPPSTRREGSFPIFKLDIDVAANDGILVKNELVDAEFRARIRLVNTIETPRLLGNVELVAGKLLFRDRVFQIQSATFNFDSPTVINPSFNASASSEINSTKIQLYAQGRFDQYKIEFTSNPVMPESEILSLLALGVTSDDIRRGRSGDRGTVQQSEAGYLVLHSLGLNKDIEEKTGFQVQLNEAVDPQAGVSAFRNRNDSDLTSSPKIVIKRRIGKKLELSVGSTVGVGSNNQQEVNLEYRMTPAFSLQGAWNNTDNQARQTAKGQQDNSLGSLGLDLKLQKRFKW